MTAAAGFLQVQVCQWWRNGDHPQDSCQAVPPTRPGVTEPSLSEGRVVRRWRRPHVSGSLRHGGCGLPMREHGWIDSGGEGRTVCPGDLVVTVDGGHYPVKVGDQPTHWDGRSAEAFGQWLAIILARQVGL